MTTTKKASTDPVHHKVIFKTPDGSVRVQINDVEQAGDGGRLVLVNDNQENDELFEVAKIQAVNLIINYRKDDPMRIWPALRADLDARRFTITVTEVLPGKGP